MIKTEHFNKIPDKHMPKLGRDDIAIFVCEMNSVEKGTGRPLFPTVGVPEKDTIYIGDETFEIAHVTSPGSRTADPKFGAIFFEPSSKGQITLKGSVPREVQLYQYLTLCNFNGSNPNRVENMPVLFRRIDSNAGRSDLQEAAKQQEQLDFVLKGDISMVKAALSQRGVDVSGMPESSIRGVALEQSKAKHFNLANIAKPAAQEPSEKPELDLAGKIKQAFDVGLIKWDGSSEGQVLRNTETDTAYPVDGIKQTDRGKAKCEKLIEACGSDKELRALVEKELN